MMKNLIKKLFKTNISATYIVILLVISALTMVGYFSYAWFTVQSIEKYSVVTGTLNGSIAIGSDTVTINGTGVITYTPTTDSDIITITVTNTSDRTVKNSIYYYTLSDSSIELGYTEDSPTVPTTTGVSVNKNSTLTYKIKINNAKGKAINIGSSMGLNNSSLSLPSGTVAFSLDSTGAAKDLIAKANKEDLDYDSVTDDQKKEMWTFSHEATEQTTALTDYRYIGADPNNYVTFNNELWRIIGVFNVDDGTGKIEKRLKIIRNESIGSYSWDNKDTTTGSESDYGKNNWSDARLNYLLNEGHESETYGGSLYWNRKSGTCYYEQNNTTVSCDFTSTGLTLEAREMIGVAKWYLGGVANIVNPTSAIFYINERGTTVYSERSISWTGKVGLMYPSDYGYATSGGSTTNRTSCLATALYNWNDSSYSDCYTNDWMYYSSLHQRTIISSTSFSFDVIDISSFSGNVSYHRAFRPEANRPVVYLKSTIKITSGLGTSSNPYTLSEN